ncbi:MAG: inosine/xanthosine triphosphatase [Chitinophagales bacterium]
MIQIVVGSKNPVKVAAVQTAFQTIFPTTTFQVEGLSSASGVSDQPVGDDETYQGAINRVVNVQNTRPEADFWVGLEGGITDNSKGMEAFAWFYILNRSGQIGKARSGGFYLPEQVAHLVRQGIELGVADDQIFGISNSKHQTGAVGLLTKNVITRKSLYVHGLCLALIPFINPALYGDTNAAI